MAKYSGSVELISGLKQANNQDFPLVDASAVQVNDNGDRLDEVLNEKLNKSDLKNAMPTALKNPNALTLKIGSTTVTYDGSAAETVEIADGSEVGY